MQQVEVEPEAHTLKQNSYLTTSVSSFMALIGQQWPNVLFHFVLFSLMFGQSFIISIFGWYSLFVEILIFILLFLFIMIAETMMVTGKPSYYEYNKDSIFTAFVVVCLMIFSLCVIKVFVYGDIYKSKKLCYPAAYYFGDSDSLRIYLNNTENKSGFENMFDNDNDNGSNRAYTYDINIFNYYFYVREQINAWVKELFKLNIWIKEFNLICKERVDKSRFYKI
jgi:hypothetical protein